MIQSRTQHIPDDACEHSHFILAETFSDIFAKIFAGEFDEVQWQVEARERQIDIHGWTALGEEQSLVETTGHTTSVT